MSRSATPIGRAVGPCSFDACGDEVHQRAVVERAGQCVPVGRVDEGGGLAADPGLGGAEDEEQDDRGDQTRRQGQSMMLRRTASSCARIGAASRQTPTTARTWPSVTSGKYSRTTSVAPRPGPTASLAPTCVDRSGRRLAAQGSGEVGRRARLRPVDRRIVRGDDPAVGQADLDPDDLAGSDELRETASRGRPAFGGRAGRAEVVGRQVAGHEQADECGVGADGGVQRGRRKVRRDERRLGHRGQTDDDQEDAVDEDQQDRPRNVPSCSEHLLCEPPPSFGSGGRP